MSNSALKISAGQGLPRQLLQAGQAANDNGVRTARDVAKARWARTAVTEVAKETVAHATPGLLSRAGSLLRSARLFTPHGLVAEILLSPSCGDSSPREMRQVSPAIIDQPPEGKPVTQWLAEMTEAAEIAARIANKRNELELARKHGQTARVQALNQELESLYAQAETIVSAHPVHGHRLQAMASAGAVASATTTSGTGIDLDNLDRSARPQDDFFQHVNGGWLDQVVLPPGVPGFGNFGVLRKANAERLQATVEAAMNGTAAPGSHQQVLGDFYASGMNAERLNQLGAEPLQSFLRQIEDISLSDPEMLEEAIGWLLRHKIPTLFTLIVDADPKQSDQYALTLDQGGLGLPERDYYDCLSRHDEASVALRKAYVDHVAKTFMLLGDNETSARQKADAVMAIETELANSSLTPVERRDLERQYNKIPLSQLRLIMPDFDWDSVFSAMGVSGVSHVIITNPQFFGAINHLMTKTPRNHWQAYLTWQWVNGASDYLGDRFADHKFEFYGKRLEGASESKPRARRVLEQTDAWFGDALGKVFVGHYFNPEAKQQVDEMVRHIVAAFRERILTRPWMSDATKAKALEKLDAMTYKIGHPDQWRDYSSVTVTPDSYFQNAMNARAFEFARMADKLGKPVDRSEWNATAPTVNANYVFEGNAMTFSAGILQPPFFDVTADPAVNFGAMGAMIGHELTHGFDDQGAQFDAQGNMFNWWTAEDGTQFAAKAAQLVQQFNGYEIQPGQFVLGELTLGENIADLGGITVAYHALQQFLAGKPRVTVDGYTPEQLFFMGYAQMWRAKYTPEFAATNFRKDVHSPARFRVFGPLSNMPEFHQAFGTQPGDAMWRDPQDRIEIW